MPLKKSEMVILDQNAVAQGVSVVGPATERHGPFLKLAPTGKRFSGVQDTHWVPAYGSTELLRQGGDSREVLKKVQRDSFGL